MIEGNEYEENNISYKMFCERNKGWTNYITKKYDNMFLSGDRIKKYAKIVWNNHSDKDIEWRWL